MIAPSGEVKAATNWRLQRLVKTGGFIPSVDHQTPPGVSLEEYRVYLRLLKEFASAWAV